jgi:transcriptional regulator with XRE-family HTH domain
VNDALNSRLLKALGQRIRELRTERGYSQESFADKCGVHRTFMGTVERGESNLSFQNIARVAEALGVTLSTLFLGLETRAENQMAVSRVAPSTPGKRRAAKRQSLPARQGSN